MVHFRLQYNTHMAEADRIAELKEVGVAGRWLP